MPRRSSTRPARPAPPPALNLTSTGPTPRHYHAALLTGLLLVLVTALTLPAAWHPGPSIPAFLPMYVVLAGAADLVTAYLLFGQFLSTRTPALATLAATYLYSGTIIVPYLLTFPRVFAPAGLLGGGPQTAVWLWTCWHGGFPLGLLLYAALDSRYRSVALARATARRLIIALVALVPALVALMVLLTIRVAAHLPVLIQGTHFTALFRLTSPLGLTLCGLSVAACGLLIARACRRSASVAGLWLAVAAGACLLDIAINLWVPGRYTVGWYVSRANTVLSASVVLGALLYEVTRLYARLAQLNTDLHVSEQRFHALSDARAGQNRALLEALPDMMLHLSPDGVVLQYKVTRDEATGPSGEGLGKHLSDVMPTAIARRVLQASDAARRTRTLQTFEYALPGRGETRHHEARIVACGGEETLALVRDVTERTRAMEALRATEERFRALFEHAPIGLYMTEPTGQIALANPALGALLGYSADELHGRAIADITHPDDRAQDGVLLQEIHAVSGQAHPREKRYLHRAGHAVPASVVVFPLRDQHGTVSRLVGMIQDNTTRQAFEDQLRHQAFHDPLTALPNRALFLDRLAQILARGLRRPGPAVVLYLDLDRFKVINDSLGHDAGDHLLIAVAARLRTCVRPEDTVARFGGDEFAVLLGEMAHGGQAIATAERIIRALAAPFRLGNHDVVIETSIGVVTTTPSATAADVMRDADVALYHAKAAGRGRYDVFDETMKVRALERLELEADLRGALERDEFTVYYQPKIALATGHLAGMEALVRWQSPTRGLVSPAAFIPVAEETGLIHPLGQWVLATACRQTRRWNAEAPGTAAVVVSVNLSPRQFTQPTLVADVARALAESGVDPRQVQLEITESVAMGDAAATVETLQRLKELGVQLAIDDFGTGYSSLAYLRRFPIDVLKIDRAFIAGLRPASEDAAIVHAVINLGHALHLRVVAEGVETAEEAAQLRAMGCELGQGYYFARPLPSAQADAVVQHRSAAA